MPRLTLRTRRSSRQDQSAGNVALSRVSTNNDDCSNDSTPITNENKKSSSSLSIASQPSQTRRPSLTASLAKLKRLRKHESNEDSLHAISRNNSITPSSTGPQLLQLPTEIQLNIVAFLSGHDILVFRRISRACRQLISSNATTVAYDILSSVAPTTHDGHNYNSPIPGERLDDDPKSFGSLLLSLYRPPAGNALMTFLRQQSRVSSFLETVLSFVQTRIYMLRLTSHLSEIRFSAYRAGLQQRLHTPLSLICHMISTIATHILYHHSCIHPLTVNPDPSCTYCQTSLAQLREKTLRKYPTQQLILMYHVLKLIYMHLNSALQPPSSIGPLERRVRGWGYGPPPEKDLSIFMIFGGADMLRKVDEMRGSYSKRLETVRAFVWDNVRDRAKKDAWEGLPEHSTLVGRRKANWVVQERERDGVRPDVLIDLEELRLDHITWAEVQCVPDLDGFLLGKNGLLDRRIRELGLVEDEWWTDGEDSDPYPWLRRLLESCLHSETSVGQLEQP